MGAGFYGGFGATKGTRNLTLTKINLQFFAARVFEKGGHISKGSFEGHREFFLGKSVSRIKKELEKQGYEVNVHRSKNKDSKAIRIDVKNPSKVRNVTAVQVSPKSKRHGEVPYVKVSTNDGGKYKIVSKKEGYKTDSKEKATIYFARRKKK
ncbi:MAG: hypothetical protein J5504_11365 [Butyrivibrio sp.]|nr:hypothetical protein [Butyrivibrio sp.]